MSDSSGHWYDDVVMPALLNAARGRRAQAVSAGAASDFEERVRAHVGTEELGRARAVLGVMVELSDSHFS